MGCHCLSGGGDGCGCRRRQREGGEGKREKGVRVARGRFGFFFNKTLKNTQKG